MTIVPCILTYLVYLGTVLTNIINLADSFGNYFSTAVRKLKTQALILKEFVWKSPRISVLRTVGI